jgi:hypothetical protein
VLTDDLVCYSISLALKFPLNQNRSRTETSLVSWGSYLVTGDKYVRSPGTSLGPTMQYHQCAPVPAVDINSNLLTAVTYSDLTPDRPDTLHSSC